MKKLFVPKNIYWFMLGLVFSLNVYGQDNNRISYSISAGVNGTMYNCGSITMIGNPESNGTNGPLTANPEYGCYPGLGGQFSFLADIPVYKCISVRTGVSYMYLRSDILMFPSPFYDDFNTIGLVELLPYASHLTTNNISIPLLIKLSGKKAKNSFYVTAGVDAIYNASSTVTNTGPEYGPAAFMFSANHSTSFGLDYSIVLGKYCKICKKQFFWEIQYNHDVTSWNYQFISQFNYPYSNPVGALESYSASLAIGWVLK